MKIQTFRTDDGLEYMNEKFINEIERLGIKKGTTCPHNASQQMYHLMNYYLELKSIIHKNMNLVKE